MTFHVVIYLPSSIRYLTFLTVNMTIILWQGNSSHFKQNINSFNFNYFFVITFLWICKERNTLQVRIACCTKSMKITLQILSSFEYHCSHQSALLVNDFCVTWLFVTWDHKENQQEKLSFSNCFCSSIYPVIKKIIYMKMIQHNIIMVFLGRALKSIGKDEQRGATYSKFLFFW